MIKSLCSSIHPPAWSAGKDSPVDCVVVCFLVEPPPPTATASTRMVPIKVPIHSVNEAAVGSDDYAVDSVDKSVLLNFNSLVKLRCPNPICNAKKD